jgi:hypothetical protein
MVAPDPYAADRALAQWAEVRGYSLNPNPDLAWYKGWYPCAYLFPIARVGREVRASFGDAHVGIVEAFEADALKQATGDDRHVFAFLTSQHLTRRAALRSKQGGGIVQELSTGLGSLFKGGGSPGGVLGDPTLEARYDVTTPTREEGHFALPIPLRQLLLSLGWRGILEIRPGGLACTMFDRRSFDPASLDWVISTLGQIYQAAIAAPGR